MIYDRFLKALDPIIQDKTFTEKLRHENINLLYKKNGKLIQVFSYLRDFHLMQK